MRKTKILKSLLVVAVLLVGSSAWADEVIETYDFAAWGASHMNGNTYATMGTTSAGFQVNSVDMYKLTVTGTKDSEFWDLSNRFAVSNNVTFRLPSGKSDVSRLGNENASGVRYISIVNLKAGDRVLLTCSNVVFYSSNATYDDGGTPTAVTGGSTNVVSGTTYTVTGEGAQRLDFTIASRTWGSITRVVVTRDVSCADPTKTITGANGISRKFTLECETEGADIYYSETERTTSDDGWTTYSGEVTTSSETIWAYASVNGNNSSVISFLTGAGTTITLNNPTISRTNSTTVNIVAPQSVLGTPTATIYYRIGESGDFAAYSDALTVSSHNTVYAYAVASGYSNSATVSKEIAFVSSFPQASILNKVNTFSSGALDTSGDGIVGTNTTYYPLVIDGNQWGSNIYFQEASAWGFRSNNTWYNNSASSTAGWVMFKDLKAGDVVVVRMSEGAAALTNATYLDAYSYSGHYAYAATTDGNMELRFGRTANKSNNVLAGIDQYPNTTFTLSANQAQRLTFHNVGSGSANNENWMMNVYNGGNKVGEVRADWWDNVAGGNANFTNAYNYSADGGITTGPNVWANYLTDMTDADVDFTVSYTGGDLYIIGTMTKDDDIYYVNYTKTGLLGDVSVYLYGNNATLSSISHVSTDVNTTYAAPSNAISVTIASSGYSSLASAYGLNFSGVDGLTAYVVTKTTNEAVTLTSVEELPANSGVILKGTAGATYSIPVKTDAAYDGTNLLSAAVTATDIAANTAYILQGGLFHLVTEASTVPAGKAYLLASNVPAGAREMKFVFDDDESTGIKMVHGEGLKVNGSVFNLNGQRVAQPAKGLYIKGGKKVVMK